MNISPDNGWFDAVAQNYSRFRPRYPDAIFQWMAERAPAQGHCWDAACGNGQASIGLADCFDHVTATDLSPEQIDAAQPHPGVTYSVGAAERTHLNDRSMDAVLVAAAIHWLDVDRFNREALRVLKPKGLLVWLGYQPIEGAPTALQSWLENLYHQRLRSFWPPQRVHVDRHYTDLDFPVPSEAIPEGFAMTVQWSPDELLSFISTWSAMRCIEQRLGSHRQQVSLLPALASELKEIWPSQSETLQLRLPLMGRWGLAP